MTDRLLIRDVPRELYEWIESERTGALLTQNEFLLRILGDARAASKQLSLFDVNPRTPRSTRSVGIPFTFIDLFAGIGGFRLALERLGGKCLFTSEWDRHAQKTYSAWFGEVPAGDIRDIEPTAIPPHHVLAAGFPCQPFSIAGVSKKKSLGREHGFKDVTQGTLFFHLAAIIEALRPPILLLENVKNLMSHDKGQTWRVIRTTLQDLGYEVYAEVLDAAAFVPQHRERVFIVGFRKSEFGSNIRFEFPRLDAIEDRPVLGDVLDKRVDPKYTLSDQLWRYLQDYAAKHQERGNGFGFGLPSFDGVARTLSARYHKDGSEILIRQRGRNPRRLTPRECARLMGFPDELDIVVSDTQAYRQFGNAVVPPVVEAVAVEIMRSLLIHLLARFGTESSPLSRTA